jgi:hypothetical protein
MFKSLSAKKGEEKKLIYEMGKSGYRCLSEIDKGDYFMMLFYKEVHKDTETKGVHHACRRNDLSTSSASSRECPIFGFILRKLFTLFRISRGVLNGN